MGRQTLVIAMEDELVRRMRNYLSDDGDGYASINEFVEVAVINQLALETEGLVPSKAEASTPEPARRNRVVSDALLVRPSGDSPLDLLDETRPVDKSLFVLTNRFNPLVVSVRALANLAARRQWPTVQEFHIESAAIARDLGLRLKARDQEEGRQGSQRLAVAYPLGEREQPSLDRFTFSFTMSEAEGGVTGPLALLGLAGIEDGRASLTSAGWRLACAPSPLIDDQAGQVLSSEQIEILREQVREAPGELEAVSEFLEAVRLAGGKQSNVDGALQAWHDDWSPERVVSHRSAMIGRLVELAVLSVAGRGPAATISIDDDLGSDGERRTIRRQPVAKRAGEGHDGEDF